MNQIDFLKSLILLIITTINMAIIIYVYNFFVYVGLRVDVYTSVRISQYITTFVTSYV